MNENNGNGIKISGIGFVGLLQIAFIVLKLVGVIDWRWVFVLLPLIISVGISVIMIAVFIIAIIIRIKKE